jgi:hypothetical protein
VRALSGWEVSAGSRKVCCYDGWAARDAERDKRASQRDAVLRLIMPLLTAFPKARLTALI